MVITDDITGNGMMDLVVSTMNGNVIALGTDVEYHPMKVRNLCSFCEVNCACVRQL